MKELISRSEFSRRSGVSPASITKACSTKLAKACVGKRIDFNHSEARAYYNDHRDHDSASNAQKEERTPRGAASNKNKKQKESLSKATEQFKNMAGNEQGLGDEKIHEVPDDIEAFADMSLRELIQRFGTEIAFMDWLKATKEIESINEKRLKNAETMGKLVSRDLVRSGIIEPFDTAHINLLTDGAKTITVRTITMHNAGKSASEIEAWVSEQITTFIRPVKSKVGRIMKKLEK